MKLRLIGDIHGRQQEYLALARGADYSIQLGDMGFDYYHLRALDPKRHGFFGGNHENYRIIERCEHNIGDYGPAAGIPGLVPTFFVRGAWSIDKKYRTPGVSWFPEEEISGADGNRALAWYSQVKPELLLTHEAPFFLLPTLIPGGSFARSMGFAEPYIPTRTNQLLDRLYESHRPKLHVFGHYHRDFDQTIDGTRFVCLTADSSCRCTQKFLDLELGD